MYVPVQSLGLLWSRVGIKSRTLRASIDANAVLLLALALNLLAGRASIAEQPDARLQALIQQLGADGFAEREAATKKLVELGLESAAAVDKAARSDPNPEVQARARRVLRLLPPSHRWPTTPEFDAARIKEKLVVKHGRIEQDEVWTADATYLVDADLVVSGNATIRIEPGTVVLVGEGVNIEITGGIERRGGAAIVARSDDPWNATVFCAAKDGKPSDDVYWGKITVLGGLALKNAQVRRSSGIVHINDPNKEMGFDGVGFYDTKGDALTFKKYRSHHGEVTIRGCTGSGMVFAEGAHPTFEYVRIFDAADGVTTASSSSPKFKRLHISSARDTGLKVTHGQVDVRDLNIEKCRIGASWSDRATGFWYETATISKCEMGLIIEGGLVFDTLRISDVSGVGVRFRDRAYARIVQIDLTRVGGTGISIEDRSYPYIDWITHTDCKGEVLHIEPGAERRKGAKEIIAKLRSDNQRGM